ncbi:MAG TPA: glycoside hydrolase domain-containing protein [Anaeromyxobacter sp.]|nr:glycoside hydrolase domain-containing protein [Anaeromyxobacter sp.]
MFDKRIAALTAALALSLAPAAADAAQVWVAGSTEKIRPDAAPRTDGEAKIAAARNEFEAFQVVVTGAASRVSAHATALTGPGTLLDVKLYREDLLDLRNASAVDGGTGRWPDALVPDVDDVVGEQRNAFPFDVNGGESRGIWIEVRVPADAKPGTYRGEVVVTAAEGEWKVPVTLEVWDFQLPSTSSLRTSFGISYGGTIGGHGVSGDANSELRARYAQLGLDHRISLTGVSDDGTDGLVNFEKWYGPLMNGTAPTRLAGAKLTAAKYVGDERSVEKKKRWAEYFRARGWMDRLFDYVCDEPPLTCAWSDIEPRTRSAHDADPELQTLVTTQLWDAQEHGVDGGIDILVPVINWNDDKPGSPVAGDQTARYDDFRSGPRKEVWLYQSCMSHGCGGTVNIGSPSESDRYFTGWPSYMVDASAVRNRAMEWLSFLMRADGELYWETTMAYSHDAWSNQWDFSGNGDGTLFYPGTPSRIGGQTHIPVASIRLKMIREGMEDYEYLKLLADAGDREGAAQIARDLFPNAYSTDVDPARLMEARAELAKRILARK